MVSDQVHNLILFLFAVFDSIERPLHKDVASLLPHCSCSLLSREVSFIKLMYNACLVLL